MISVDSELMPVISDYENALNTLNESLDHISETRPSPDLRILFSNSTIVSLVSISEEALRNLFQQYLHCIENLVSSHSGLRKELQQKNAHKGIDLLKKVAIPSGIQQARDIIAKLDLCLSGGPSYKLFREQLTYNQGNFRSAQISEIAKTCGISDFLKTTCDCTSFADFFDDQNLERRITIFATRWNEVFDERDTIVHRISQASGWADQRIRLAIEFFRFAMRRIADCLVFDAKSFTCPSA